MAKTTQWAGSKSAQYAQMAKKAKGGKKADGGKKAKTVKKAKAASKAKWTVMVLMGANNLANEADLTSFAADDIREMQAVGSVKGALNVVVQIDQKKNGGPRRFKVTKGGLVGVQALPDGQGNSGDPAVLENFVRWAMERFDADHFMLVIWGHAWRFAFARNGEDALDFTKLSNVLRRTNGNKKLDIVAFDSCGVGWIEVAYQLRDVADYLVASQFMDPLPGWPYDEVLGRVVKDDPPMTPVDLARTIVSQFVRHYDKAAERHAEISNQGNQNVTATVTMTAIDLSRAQEIREKVRALSNALALAVDSNGAVIKDAFERAQVPVTREPAVDLTTLCWNLLNYCPDEGVRRAAAGIGDLLLSPSDSLITAHGRSDLIVAMLCGVSIFAPGVKPDFNSLSLRPTYEALDLPRETGWGRLVYGLAELDY